MSPLTPSQALRNAIAAEAAAARFYETLASRSSDPEVRSFFETMVRVEAEHGREIEQLGSKMVGQVLPAFATTDASGVETLPAWKSAENLGFDEALHVAVMCEHQAAMHYADLAELFDGEVREFFRAVSASESQHGSMIEGVLRERIRTGQSTFTIGQVVRNLIEIERAAARFYGALAKRCLNPRAKSFLQGMVEVEELHAAQIEALGRDVETGEIPEHANLEVKDVEMPPSWPAPIDLRLETSLALALEAERRAGRYYRALSRCFSGQAADFLEHMAETEDDHARSIEDLLTRMRADA